MIKFCIYYQEENDGNIFKISLVISDESLIIFLLLFLKWLEIYVFYNVVSGIEIRRFLCLSVMKIENFYFIYKILDLWFKCIK